MSLCASCEDTGLVPFVRADNPTSDTEIGADDLHFALCLCEYGQSLRLASNHKRAVTPLWLVWCAAKQINPARVHRIEDVYSAEELAAAGFSKPVATINREAQLLAASRRRK